MHWAVVIEGPFTFSMGPNTHGNPTEFQGLSHPSIWFLYLSIGFVFCCFGQINKQMDLQTCITLAFEAIASSSGGIQTLIDTNISQDDRITTMKK